MEEWRAIFGARLRRARNEVPLTQTELAFLLKVAQTTVSAWERGIAVPRDELRPKIARILHCPISILFDYPADDANGDTGQAA